MLQKKRASRCWSLWSGLATAQPVKMIILVSSTTNLIMMELMKPVLVASEPSMCAKLHPSKMLHLCIKMLHLR